jgi:hypothetical protein
MATSHSTRRAVLAAGISPVSVPDCALSDADVASLIAALVRGKTIHPDDSMAVLMELKDRRITDNKKALQKQLKELRARRNEVVESARYWRGSTTHPEYCGQAITSARYWNHRLVQVLRSHRKHSQVWSCL